MMCKTFFLACIMALSLLQCNHKMLAMEMDPLTNSDEKYVAIVAIHFSKKMQITFMMVLAYLLHKVLTEEIICHMTSTEHFSLPAHPDESNEEHKINKLTIQLENLNIAREIRYPQDYDSTNNLSTKKISLILLLNWLPHEILTEKIIPFMISIENFWLFTNSEEAKKELENKMLTNPNLNDAAQELSNLDDAHVILQTNMAQLNRLDDSEKCLCLNNVLNCIEGKIFNNVSARAILVSLLNRCNKDFYELPQKEKDEHTLEDLITEFKKTFDYKSPGIDFGGIIFHGVLGIMAAGVGIGLRIITNHIDLLLK